MQELINRCRAILQELKVISLDSTNVIHLTLLRTKFTWPINIDGSVAET